jgi:hypothetical protein
MRLVSFCALLVLAAPAVAQDAQPEKPKEEKKTCRSIMTTGSILGGKRECHTKAEWAAISDHSRQDRELRDREMRGRNGGIGVTRD